MNKSMRWSFPLIGAVLLWGATQMNRPSTTAKSSEEENAEAEALAEESYQRKSSSTTPTRAPAQAVPVVSPSTTAATAATKDLSELTEISRLRDCLVNENCEFPKNDPRTYGFAVSAEWKKQLLSLSAKLAADPSIANEAEQAAREAMQHDDGHVQEAALKIFEQLPTNPENLNSIVEGLHNNPADPLIVDQATKELSRYVPGPNENTVHRFFAETISSGAIYTAQQAGIAVKRVLTPESIPGYRRVLQTLPADSTTARSLRSILDEYERQQSGG